MTPLPITPWFAWSSKELGLACSRLGLEAPAFRSPPSVPGADRTLRRIPGGRATVAVRLWGRSFVAIRADMIEGVLAANAGAIADADAVRRLLEDFVPVPGADRAA